MMLTTLLLAVVGLAQPAAGAPAAPPRPAPDCRDDNLVDRCAEAEQRRVRALYGVRSIEEHRAAGDQVRRVFYIDGYGRDLVAIAFVRAPGRDPTLSVHYPRREGEARPEPLSAPVPQAAWDDLLFRSALFDRALVPAPRPGNATSICLHSWVYTVEASDPARSRDEPARVRRATEDACENGLAKFFALEVERAALPLFAYCNRLDPTQHRNPASQLAACRMLSADRLAAAEVLNRLGVFQRVAGPDDASLVAGSFESRAAIEWNGERNQGSNSAAVFWARKVGEAHGANFHPLSVEGISGSRVRVTGRFHRGVEAGREQGTAGYFARVEMIWVFGPAQQFQVENASVGPWEPEPRR